MLNVRRRNSYQSVSDNDRVRIVAKRDWSLTYRSTAARLLRTKDCLQNMEPIGLGGSYSPKCWMSVSRYYYKLKRQTPYSHGLTGLYCHIASLQSRTGVVCKKSICVKYLTKFAAAFTVSWATMD